MTFEVSALSQINVPYAPIASGDFQRGNVFQYSSKTDETIAIIADNYFKEAVDAPASIILARDIVIVKGKNEPQILFGIIVVFADGNVRLVEGVPYPRSDEQTLTAETTMDISLPYIGFNDLVTAQIVEQTGIHYITQVVVVGDNQITVTFDSAVTDTIKVIYTINARTDYP